MKVSVVASKDKRTYNLTIKEAPKVLEIFLNNEKIKRNSVENVDSLICGYEKKLYDEWIKIYRWQIKKYYGLPEEEAQKLAKENALYIVSIFSPLATLKYKANIQQLSYIDYWFEYYIENAGNSPFSGKLKTVMKEFLYKLNYCVKIPKVDTLEKSRGLSIFTFKPKEEVFGKKYCTTYEASFAELIESQMYVNIDYSFMFNYREIVSPRIRYYNGDLLEMGTETKYEAKFYIPELIKHTEVFYREWLSNISSRQWEFPLGMLLKVTESGNIKDFTAKYKDSLYGRITFEVVKCTNDVYENYIEAVKEDQSLYKYFEQLESSDDTQNV